MRCTSVIVLMVLMAGNVLRAAEPVTSTVHINVGSRRTDQSVPDFTVDPVIGAKDQIIVHAGSDIQGTGGYPVDPLNDCAEITALQDVGTTTTFDVRLRKASGAIYRVEGRYVSGSGNGPNQWYAEAKDKTLAGTLTLTDTNGGCSVADSENDPAADPPRLYCVTADDGKGDVSFNLYGVDGNFSWTITPGEDSGLLTGGNSYSASFGDLEEGPHTLTVTGTGGFVRRIDFSIIRLELKASNGLTSSAAAATVNAGTSSSPKTLLAGMHFYWPAADMLAAHIDLSAYSNGELTEQQFPDNDVPVWTVEGPVPGNFDGNQPNADRKKTGTNVSFYAAKEGLYTLTCAVKKTAIKTIKVYVAYPRINEYPEYMFANTTTRIPLGFTIMGAGGNNVKVKDGGINEFRLRYFSNTFNMYLDLTYDNNLDKFAPTWDDTESKNGTSASYKVVSKASPLVNMEIPHTAGLYSRTCLSLTCEALLVIGEEETNYCWLPPATLEDVKDIKLVDKRWQVIEIGTDKTVSNHYACLTGTGRYYHLASDDNDYECAGTSASTGENGTFVAGSDERYDGVNYHYHYGDTSTTLFGPRGFDEEPAAGCEGDYAVAGMTKEMDSDGLVVEARLYDDGDLWSDDEEEYLAKALGGGISSVATVAYKRRTSDYFGIFYDLRAAGQEGNIFPRVLPNAQWRLHLTAEATSWAGQYGGAALNDAGLALALAGGALLMAPNPPAWAVVAVTVGGIVVSGANVLNDIDGWTSYGDQKAIAVVRYALGTVHWSSGQISTNYTSASGAGSDTLVNYGADGALAPAATSGIHVVVGDQVRCGFETEATAQNASYEWESTPDVIGRLTLERSQGSNDLRSISYEWK